MYISGLLAFLLLFFKQPCSTFSKKEKLNLSSSRSTSPVPRQSCCSESGGTKGPTHFYSAHMPASAGGGQDSERRTGRGVEKGRRISNSKVVLPRLALQDTFLPQKLRSDCLGVNLMVALTMQELGGGGGERVGRRQLERPVKPESLVSRSHKAPLCGYKIF